MNWGNSSILNLLIIFPKANTLLSPVWAWIASSSLVFSSKCIDLNFQMTNLFPAIPTRSCLKNKGPGDWKIWKIFTTNIAKGNRSKRLGIQIDKSNTLLIIRLKGLCKGSFNNVRNCLPDSSMNASLSSKRPDRLLYNKKRHPYFVARSATDINRSPSVSSGKTTI